MYDYSSYDSYFGLNRTNMMPLNNMGTNIRPGGIGKIPGINAPKESKSNEAVGILAGLASAVAAGILIFKGKGKISKLFKEKGFTKALGEIGQKIKGAFTGKLKKEGAEAATSTSFIQKIKNFFTKKPPTPAAAATTEVVEEGLQESRNKFVDALKALQNKVNSTPGVKDTDKVGDLLKNASAEDRKQLLGVLKGIQSQVNSVPGVKDTDTVGQVLNLVSK